MQIKEIKMNQKKKQTHKKNFLLSMGISFSLVFLCSGIEAAPIDNNLIQPLSFNSIVNSHSLINVDGIAFMCGNSSKSTTNTNKDTSTTPTTDSKTKKEKDGKKIVTDQKNSTSHRRVIIDD